MGYDCTLHLVDEAAIHDGFVPKLLGTSRRKTPLDEKRDDAPRLWGLGRRALRERLTEDGEDMGASSVASLLCQLAILYSDCMLPNHYERGMAFSLWPDDMEPFPTRFAHSPEPLFAAVVEQHPWLKGKFPKWFDLNYSTGVYIPAAKVPEVRAWLEGVLAPLPKGTRREYRGFLAVLEAAEERGCAYWEATDLAAGIGGHGETSILDAWSAKHSTYPIADSFRLRGGQKPERCGGSGSTHVLSEAMPDATLVVEMASWPPKVRKRKAEWVLRADQGGDGDWLIVSRAGAMHGAITPVLGRIHDDLRKPPLLVLSPGAAITDGFMVAGRAVLIPDTNGAEPGNAIHALMQEGEGLVVAPGLPPHAVKKSSYANVQILCGIARLAAGDEILVWDGDGYEWDGERFQKTFSLGLKDIHFGLSAIPAGEDGFFFIDSRKVWEIHRGKKKVRRCPKWTNVLSMQPGPEGGILLLEGGNPDDDLGKLWFPAEGTFIHLEPELLGDQDLFDFLCWSERAGRIIASDHSRLWSVPVERVLALPRFDVRTGKPQ